MKITCELPLCLRTCLLASVCSCSPYDLHVCVWYQKTTKEEDATVWVRYSSAQFDQGAGRRACNNPYNHVLDCELFQKMETAGKTHTGHKDFLDLISPSMESEDMSAILAHTHIIVLIDNGVCRKHSQGQCGLHPMAGS